LARELLATRVGFISWGSLPSADRITLPAHNSPATSSRADNVLASGSRLRNVEVGNVTSSGIQLVSSKPQIGN
jgi:hypothetical protein